MPVQVQAAEAGGAGLPGGGAPRTGGPEPGAEGQGRVGGAGDPVCEGPADRGVQGQEPEGQAGHRHSMRRTVPTKEKINREPFCVICPR